MTLETLVPVNDSAPRIAAVRRIFSGGPGNPAAGTCGTLRRLPLSPPGYLPVSEGTNDVRASIMLCSASSVYGRPYEMSTSFMTNL